MRVLLVEDDRTIASQLAMGLKREGYEVEVTHDGESGLHAALSGRYGVMILDLMLPRRDGFSVCAALRSHHIDVPVLMLTARDEVTDKVRGLDAGADDYLAKPFDFQELLARLRALQRRGATTRASVIEIGDLSLDTSAKVVRREGKEIHLTPREYSLLEALARNRGRVLPREMIQEQIWGDDESLANAVNYHITSLRKKIDAGRETSLIQTVHGFGYTIPAEP